MASRVFALLVGINDYEPSVGRLYGCLSDVERYEEYLTSTFSKNRLQLKTLKDSQATAAGIQEAFEQHLCEAKSDDVVLFQYSGHGARSKSSDAFRDYFPGGWDEGLVCYDSRRRDAGNDLADKELAVLLAKVAEKDPHVVVLLDCCHSGSGTRQADDFLDLRPRMTHTQLNERSLESYSNGFYATQLEQKKRLEIPGSKHVLLAACTKFQQAFETHSNSGVFTSTLLDELKHDSESSYADLFVRIRSSIRRTSFNQNPQFESFGGFSAHTRFLSSEVVRKQRRFTIYFEKNAWNVECGAIHGLPTDPDQNTEFAVHQSENSKQPVARATPTKLKLAKSEIKFHDSFRPDHNAKLYGELSSMPLPPLSVVLQGDQEGIEILEEYKNQNVLLNGIEFIKDIQQGFDYVLCAEKKTFRIKALDTGKLLYGVSGYNAESAKYIFSRLRHIASWERQLALQNHSSKVDPEKFEFKFLVVDEDETEIDDYPEKNIVIDISEKDGVSKRLRGRLKAKNASKQNLHFMLVHFSDRFGIQLISNMVQEPSKDSLFTFAVGKKERTAFRLKFNDEVEPESTDRFLLIVSAEKVEDFLVGAAEPSGFGEDVDLRATTRSIEFDEDDDDEWSVEPPVDWFTKLIKVKLVRQTQSVDASKVTELAGGSIRIQPHKLKATVGMTAAPASSRSVEEGADFYRGLERQNVKLVNFAATRGEASNVLELSNIENEASLGEQPLKIEVNHKLQPNESLFAATFDGEIVQLVGDSHTDEQGTTHVVIHRLPEVRSNRRSVVKALKLYFFKTFFESKNVNQLRRVEFLDNGSIRRTANDLKSHIDSANRILLLIHGIIGDTRGIASGVNTSDVLNGDTIQSRFDLVLTYDYENLNTPIEQTARQLKHDLLQLGIDGEDRKHVTIVAHSMGGLVSRWLIEKEGGDKFVDHLVMCGTPNQGSPFGFVGSARNVFGGLTMLAMNAFPAVVPHGVAVLAGLNRTEKLTVCLEQMKPGSDFLNELNSSNASQIPYTVIAGDIQQYDESSQNFLNRVVTRVGKSFILNQLFNNEAHDLAVQVASILGVKTKDNLMTRSGAPCHHLNYFSSDEGLAKLAEVEW